MSEIRIVGDDASYEMTITDVSAAFDGEYIGSGVDIYWTLAAIDDRATPMVFLPDGLAQAGDRDLSGEAVDLGTAIDFFQPFIEGMGDS